MEARNSLYPQPVQGGDHVIGVEVAALFHVSCGIV